jgi:hypothetical protein
LIWIIPFRPPIFDKSKSVRSSAFRAARVRNYADYNVQPEVTMDIKSLSAAVMAAGLFLAAPAFAQSTATPQNPPKKTQTQEGAPAIPTTANDYKQRTQEGAPAIPTTANDYKPK